MKEEIVVYYDGECRFCKHYARYLWLFKKYTLVLRNARDYKEDIDNFYKKWYDINQGMIVNHSWSIFHGVAWVLYLDWLLSEKDMTQRKDDKPSLMYRLWYNGLNVIRKLFLILKGVEKIR